MGINILKKLKKSRATTRSPPEQQEDAESVAVEKLDQDDTITPQTTESTSSEDDELSPPVATIDRRLASVVDYQDTSMNSKEYSGHKSSDGLPVISSEHKPHFRPSDCVGSQQIGFKDLRSGTVPSLRESAYAGPPRYDWVDVVSTNVF